MAHLALTLDPDPDRRNEFARMARRRLEFSTNLQIQSLEIGDLQVVWGRGPRSPSSHSCDGEQCSLLIGYAIDDEGRRRSSIGLSKHIASSSRPSTLGDGYYAAVDFTRDRGLTVMVDPLGMFPWYWSTSSGVLVAATSGELIASHPWVELQIDPGGLAGILLTNGILNQQSLFRNIYRMRAGHRLAVLPGKEPIEQQEYEFTRDDSLQQLSFDEACDVVGGELQRAISRHRPQSGQSAHLLSGGLDSRLMAGFLQQSDAMDSAVCFGLPHDYEARAALQVGKALDIPVYLDSYEPSAVERCKLALAMARWGHLSGGFGSVNGWTHDPDSYRKPDYFWSGYLLDESIGGLAVLTGRNPQTKTWSFGHFMGQLNRWGLPKSTLESLLRIPHESTMLDDVIAQWKFDYEHTDWLPWQRSFSMKLKTRSRFHIGGHIHRLSFQSWPLLPMLDRRLLHVLFNLNPEWHLDRRLETAMLRQGFPELAAIPFDTNSFRFLPQQVKQGTKETSYWLKVQNWFQKNSQRVYWTCLKKAEPRRYHRLYDLNAPQWSPIRILAEKQREQVHELLNEHIVDSLLPSPKDRIPFRDPFAQGAPVRAILGLMLWYASLDVGVH